MKINDVIDELSEKDFTLLEDIIVVGRLYNLLDNMITDEDVKDKLRSAFGRLRSYIE